MEANSTKDAWINRLDSLNNKYVRKLWNDISSHVHDIPIPSLSLIDPETYELVWFFSSSQLEIVIRQTGYVYWFFSDDAFLTGKNGTGVIGLIPCLELIVAASVMDT